MAPPPPKKALTKEDVPGAPEWLERLLGPINAFFGPAGAALARGLTFRENFAGEVKVVEVTPPDDWTRVSFNTGYAQVSNPDFVHSRYRKHENGWVEVELAVAVSAGFGGAASNIMFTLPAAFSPEGTLVDVMTRHDGGASGVAQVRATGAIYARFGSAGNGDYSTRLIFSALDRSPPRWATPVDVRLGAQQTPFPGKPGAVLVLGVRQKGNVAAPAFVTGLDWEPINLERQKAAPGVRLHRVWGLTPGVTYLLTLLVLPE